MFKKTTNLGGRRTESADDVFRELPLVLEDLRKDAAIPGVTILEIQPLLQIVSATSYARWATGWQHALHKANVPTPRLRWPEALPHTDVAVLALALPVGRVGRASGKYPTPLAEPLLAHAALPTEVPPATFALGVLLRWLQGRGSNEAARLAPPVVETLSNGRLLERTVQTYGQQWDLPAPDGV